MLSHRKEVMSERLMALAVQIHHEHCGKIGVSPPDVVKNQVWHRSFDPHTMVPDLEPLPLQPPVNHAARKTANVSHFMKREEIKNTDDVMLNEAQTSKIEQLAKTSGLSVATLMQVKKLETKINERKEQQQKVVANMDQKRQVQQLTTLASAIRQVLLFKQTQTIKLPLLLNSLQSNN